jgi:hypothetical protein
VHDVGDSIMITIIDNVSRVTSARRSEELAESHVNKTTWPATENRRSPKARACREVSKHQVATHLLSHLKLSLPLINDNTARFQRSLRNGQKNRRRQQYILPSSATHEDKWHVSATHADTRG